MISQFLSKLNPSQRSLVFLGGFAAFAMLFFFLFISPSLRNIDKLNDKIAKQESTIRQNMAFLATRDQVITASKAYASFYMKDQKAEEQVIADFLKRVEVIANRANVQVSKITPAGQTAQKDYLKYMVNIDCTGSLDAITNFVYAINNAGELLKVEKMNLASRGGDVLQASLSISKMLISDDPAVAPKDLVKAQTDGKPAASQK